MSDGDSADVDNTGYPVLYIGANDGRLSFSIPGDGEWEGGIRDHPVLGGRKYFQLDYIVNVTMTDITGVSNTETIRVTFRKHGNVSVPPIVLDLDGDGIELVSLDDSTTFFDMDLDGIKDRTGWVGADDGILALDRNADGTIGSIDEISFRDDSSDAISDLEGLRAFDTNEDGIFDADDERFGEFRIWKDANQDGVSQADELKSLGQSGVDAINLTITINEDAEHLGDNVIYATSSFTRTDGSMDTVGDVFLSYEPSKDDDLAAPIILDLDPADPPASVAPPIVFDFDGDNAGLVALSDSTTLFDINSDGIADRTGWIEQGDALLALDRNGNGTIDGIGEISFVGDKEGAKTDLEGLAGFDSNGDGLLDGEDEKFVEFKLWFDGNANGKTDAGELLSLAESGVNAITLQGVATGATQVAGSNIVYNTSTYSLSSGKSGQLLDAGFAFEALTGLPETVYQHSDWVGRARQYSMNSTAGALHVTTRDAKGLIDVGAGLLAPAAMLSFANGNVGLLSTILVDLDNDGLEARNRTKTGAAFDMDGDTVADDTGWVEGGDGMLVIDRNGDGLVTDASELSFLSEKTDAKSALDGLSVLDNSKDGKITDADARFDELKIWADRNANGVTDEGELLSLAETGISEISLASTPVNADAKLGKNMPLATATFKWTNGVTGTIGNVVLAFDPSSMKADATELVAANAEPTTQAAASQLLQAMSSFGAGTSEGSLSALAANQTDGRDWFAASAA